MVAEVISGILTLALFILFAVFFAFVGLGLLLHRIESTTMSLIARAFGYKGIIVTGLGTVCHETGHYLMCLLFGHKVVKVELFRPQGFLQDGVLGRVSHSYNKRNVWQSMGNFFIGVGPIIFGVIVLSLLLWILLPASGSAFGAIITSAAQESGGFIDIAGVFVVGFAQFLGTLFALSNLVSWQFWVFIFIAASISVHMSLSGADLKGCGRGVGWLLLLVLIVAAVMYLLGFSVGMSWVIIYNIYVCAFMLFGILMSLLVLGFAYVCNSIKRARRRARRRA